MVVNYHEALRLAEKLVHYLQCQGHSEGLIKQNMTISAISSKLSLTVLHHKLECPVEKLDYCIQGQGHSKGSKCQ